MSTNQTATSYHKSLNTTKIPTTYGVNVLVWDRRKNVAELNRFKDIMYRLSVPDLPIGSIG